MFPPPEYSNYWLDLARREREQEQRAKKEAQQAILAQIIALAISKKKF